MSSALTRSQKVAAAAARIFGMHVGNGMRSGRKVLAKALAGPKMLEWYAEAYPIGVRRDPLYECPEAAFRADRVERLKRRGKVQPKKGEGKRSKKKK